MDVRKRPAVFWVLFVLGAAFTLSAIASADEPVDPVKAVQGKWVRHQQTANGRVTIIKDHTGTNTILTAYDDRDNVIYSHKSEYKIENSGKVHIFTFFNRTITAGPNAGQAIKEPISFLYRVSNDRFIEVHGVLDGDTAAPNMIIWERMAEDVKPSRNDNPQAGIPVDDVKIPQPYVTCRATFAAYNQDYPWFDNSSFGHDYGRAPLASFVLVEPAMYANRAVDILFKYAGDTSKTSPPDKADIGRQFTIQIPEAFLKGKSNTIDNASVRYFRKIER